MTYIIAEIGVNHNGSLAQAIKLIDVAVECGANAVKFQTFNNEKLCSINTELADYQKKNTNKETQNNLLKTLELSNQDFKFLFNKCIEQNIEFISTPFDLDAVDFLNNLGVSIFKVGSGDLTNYLLLKKIAQTGKKVILSTGMSSLDEIRKSVYFLKENGCNNLVILHCVSSYPTQYEDLNLNCINTLINEFGCDIGFSDHTVDYKASLYSIMMGATYIEKHFTLDKNIEGPDHKASLNPLELKEFIKLIRECDIIKGDGIKKCKDSELKNKSLVRRSLFLNNNKLPNEIIEEDDLIALRPNNGICVSDYKIIIGKKINKRLEKGDLLLLEDIY
jgi:N,N'-diacetyllegionaminate synthase